MKFTFPFLLLSFLSCSLAASKSEKQQIVDLAIAGNGLINLDTNTFDLLTSPHRDWSVSVLFTALDTRRRCLPCKEFDPSWNAVARAWATTSKQHRDTHFFATLDFDNGQTIFQKIGLTSAPVVYVYPPVDGPRAPANGKTSPSKYDFSSGFDAGPLAAHLSKHTPIPIPYRDPIDWARWISAATGVLGCILMLRFIAPILQSRWVWAIITIITSLIMTSGYMFTRIRGSPYTGGDGNWLAGGFQNQFGQEVSVVAFIYGLLASAFLMLISIIPRQTSPHRQRLQVYLWTGVIMILYSVLLSIFRVKNRGYPFRLFL
ncbi:oligosaccharyl transferase subunit OST3/OST6 family [Tricholoma matsutake]|nr:oligosaccharyl transferase subunit OST3/OST6 family [Tricholoma matsutake 945]